VAVPDGVTTVIGPVDTPLGTVAVICVVEFKTKLASTPLNLTALGVMKFVPVIVTTVPVPPVVGVNEEIVGVGSFVPFIVNALETSKKTFPTASTLIIAFGTGVPGIVTTSEPSFGVLFARMTGNVNPELVDIEIFTAAQLTGALFVFATFQVTFWVEPAVQTTAADGLVTSNGPASARTFSCVSAEFTAPPFARLSRTVTLNRMVRVVVGNDSKGTTLKP
jgi:hypothetical protein